ASAAHSPTAAADLARAAHVLLLYDLLSGVGRAAVSGDRFTFLFGATLHDRLLGSAARRASGLAQMECRRGRLHWRAGDHAPARRTVLDGGAGRGLGGGLCDVGN